MNDIVSYHDDRMIWRLPSISAVCFLPVATDCPAPILLIDLRIPHGDF